MIDDSEPRPFLLLPLPSATTLNEAQLSRGQNRGQIAISETRSGGPGPLDVSFESDSTTMISLESLGTDDRGFTYVALETTPSGDAAQPIVVNKIIRKYSRRRAGRANLGHRDRLLCDARRRVSRAPRFRLSVNLQDKVEFAFGTPSKPPRNAEDTLRAQPRSLKKFSTTLGGFGEFADNFSSLNWLVRVVENLFICQRKAQRRIMFQVLLFFWLSFLLSVSLPRMMSAPPSCCENAR
jgi:hypothetical protein